MLDPPGLITIQIIGVEDLESPRRTQQKNARESLRFYGHRTNDAARRVVVIELPMKEAAEYMTLTAQSGDFLEIEIDNRHWAYAAIIGKGEARFRKEGGPNGNPAG
jgi:hypothetical protein